MLTGVHYLLTAYSSSQWQAAFRSIHQATHCNSHVELMLKITNRWYYTPFKLAKKVPPFLHAVIIAVKWGIFCTPYGNAPASLPSRTKTFQLISTSTGILTKPNPALVLLNIGIDLCPSRYRQVITYILLAAHLMIPRTWKSTLALNISDVERTVDHNYAFECILALNVMKHETFAISWCIWMSRRITYSGLSSL